jgi:hypothetical protein
VPITVVGDVISLDEAIDLANSTEYGLTAGIFSEDDREIEQFFNRIHAGVTYANRRAGATTGAWPGINSFGGWKASGSTGRGTGGPYYVQQFMREQSRVRIREHLFQWRRGPTPGGNDTSPQFAFLARCIARTDQILTTDLTVRFRSTLVTGQLRWGASPVLEGRDAAGPRMTATSTCRNPAAEKLRKSSPRTARCLPGCGRSDRLTTRSATIVTFG